MQEVSNKVQKVSMYGDLVEEVHMIAAIAVEVLATDCKLVIEDDNALVGDDDNGDENVDGFDDDIEHADSRHHAETKSGGVGAV